MSIGKTTIVLLLAALLLGISGCGDDDGNGTPTGPAGDEIPNPALFDARVPYNEMMMSGVSRPVTAGTLLLSGLTLEGLFDIPVTSSRATPSLRTAQDSLVAVKIEGDLTITVIYKETTEIHDWRVVYDGSDGVRDFDNFTLLEAEQSKADRSGTMTTYGHDAPGVVNDWSWSVDSDEDFMITLEFTSLGDNILVTTSALDNGTGSVTYERNGTQQWLVTWGYSSSGVSGFWYEYDAGGSTTDLGPWSYSGT